MPIKFRCQHCRQFLGISRAQASCVVDCPTCGRTIRVPDLDGLVLPLPKPKINAEDSQLARALEAVAAIGNVDASESAKSDQFDETAGSGPSRQVSVVKHAVKPIELEPLPAPEPVELSPVAPPANQQVKDNLPGARMVAPHREWQKLIAAAASDDADASTDEPQARASVWPALPNNGVGPAHPPTRLSAKTSPTTIFALIGVAAMIFAAGFWLGRVTTINGTSPAQAGINAAGNPAGPGNDIGGGKVDVANLDAAFRGRITYQTEAGDRRADKGARIIVLPADRPGSAKLPIAGFQTGAAIQDRRIAIASIREMGGDFCITSDDGGFDVTLKSSGQFHVIVLSNSLSREPSDEDPTVEQLIAQYFDRSNQLVGRVKYHMEKVRYSGDGTEPWDFSFQRS